MPAPSHQRLPRQLRDGTRGGVFFLYGDEEHLKDLAAREVIAAHLDPATRDFNLDEVHGSDVTPETLGSLIQTPPMMADFRVVVVRGAEALAVSSTSRGMLEDVVKAPPPGLALILLANLGSSKAKIWKTLQKQAISAEFGRLSDADLPGWLMEWARGHDIELEPDAARALGTAIGADLATLVHEMEKLRDYLGDRTTITRTDVEKVVGVLPRQDRWEWMDLVASQQFDRARAGLPILLETGESGVGLVIGLGSQFLRLGICVEGGRGALAGALPPHQKWLARKIEGQARRWTGAAIARAVEDLVRADRLLKSAPLTDLQIMEELLLRLQHAREAAA